MQTITTTELRTKSKELINTLISGGSVNIIHRSKTIGEISPKAPPAKIFTKKDLQELQKIAKEMNLPKLSYKERESRYRAAMMKKHG